VLLRRLTGLLVRLHERSAQNKMSLTNLATVHGPNILKPQREESPLQLVANTALANSVAHDLIARFGDIFEVRIPIERTTKKKKKKKRERRYWGF
jgi:hypothetical protein